MVLLKECPLCNFIVLIREINFENMTYYLVCPKCGYVEME